MLSDRFKILCICVLVVVGIALSLRFFMRPHPDASEGITPLMVSSLPAEPAHEIHILFIGNSYTFYNNMPQMLVKIAESDPDNNTRFVVQSVTRGGIALKDLWNDGDARRIIHEKHWDYVVLQEQSFWAMTADSIEVSARVFKQFDYEVKKASARTLLYTTWARKPGSQWYTERQYAFLKDPRYMQNRFDIVTQKLASDLDATAIPVGDYWVRALAKQPDAPLYMPDATHPSMAGSYLTALVFYRYLAGHTPDKSTYTPSGVSKKQAAFLKSVATW